MSSGNSLGDSVEAIEADIAQTRAELADTVDQLAAKLDVKTRATTWGAGGAMAVIGAAAAALFVWRRKR